MIGCRRSWPSARAARYQTMLPSIAPAVPDTTDSVKLSLPLAAATPATGMMTSDGIGGKNVLGENKEATPRKPHCSIRRATQSLLGLVFFVREAGPDRVPHQTPRVGSR